MDSPSEAVSQERSLEFVRSLVQEGRDAGLSEETAIYKVMDYLQTLADKDIVSALVLMARLAPMTSELYMHDVWHSIGLWMFHNMSEKTRHHLEKMMLSDPDESMHRHYKMWISFEGTPP